MARQKTIKTAVTVEGRGLFSGVACRLRFSPAQENSGIVFVRDDLDSPSRIPADISKVVPRPRRTTLANGTVAIETVEHVLAAVWGLGIDNLTIEMNAEETPSVDGSPLLFTEALQKAGIVAQDSEVKTYLIEEAVSVSDGDTMLAALPGSSDCLDILYDMDYSDIPNIGRQVFSFRLDADDFAGQLASARTFSLESEARELQARGLGTHLTAGDVLVVGPDGPIDNELRFPDEYVRHKICDLIGDLSLLGSRLRGRLVACKSGHELNQSLIRRLVEHLDLAHASSGATREPVMDIRKIIRLLPHRYPFLMVDRIIELQAEKRAVGIKNVTINEPYFQGHYPGQPIMPGVMILEALAQLSGILLSRRLEHTGKVAVLLSMDRVKMRRPVRPGDQLILEAETLHVRTRTGHCRCRALVNDVIAAEAEIKFMLVDADPA